MQSDVTLVGGTTPPASIPTPPSPAKMATQVATTAPTPNLAAPVALPKPSSTGQTAAVTEAKIALATKDAPTPMSEAERVLKPYGVTMLPEPPAESGAEIAESPEETPVEDA